MKVNKMIFYFDLIALFCALFCVSFLSGAVVPDKVFIYNSTYATNLSLFALYFYFRINSINVRFYSLADVVKIIKLSGFGLLYLISFSFIFNHYWPLNFYFLFPFAIFTLLSFPRFVAKWIEDRGRFFCKGHPVLVIGAGISADSLIHDMLRDKDRELLPVAILDDDVTKHNTQLQGVSILGAIRELETVCIEKKIKRVIIAIKNADSKLVRFIYATASQNSIACVTLPSLIEISKGHSLIDSLRSVTVEDLLGRSSYVTNVDSVINHFKDKVIIVSGGGGSIGSQISSDLITLLPAKIIVIDNSEYNLYRVEKKLNSNSHNVNVRYLLDDITCYERMEEIYKEYRPDIVFHAAAYKHVPIIERSPHAAIHTNIIGTKNLIDLSDKYNIKKFIQISSDKAVNPTNVMGETKRICELMCYFKNRCSTTSYSVVRFGNVIGSSGSVIPLFKQQIKNRGPLTVTHKDITRYFMTIKEAVSLIFEASILQAGGEVFVLDMGSPIKIKDIAEHLIKLSGYIPYKDIGIIYTGLRPGEKLYEELFYNNNNVSKTAHEKIFVSNSSGLFPKSIEESINDLIENFSRSGNDRTLELTHGIVNEAKVLENSTALVKEKEPCV